MYLDLLEVWLIRVLVSAGGTGGHVYPALAVANQVVNAPRAGAIVDASPNRSAPGSDASDRSSNPCVEQTPELLWIGSKDGVERNLVEQAGLPYQSVPTGQLRGKSPSTVVSNLGKMLVGVGRSVSLIRDLQPDVCLVTGGYVCTPVTIACRLMGIPVLIYLPDMTPGMAVRWLSLLADRVAVTFPEVSRFFEGKAVVTGYPVRQDLVDAASDKNEARCKLGNAIGFDWTLPAEHGGRLPLLLVFGGSRGARSINLAVWSALDQILPNGQILHIVGKRDWPMLEDQMPVLSGGLESRYHPVPYLYEEMAWALAASDLVVARAGASILGEFPIARLPAILVPLPIAGGHQTPNARKLVDVGGAEIVWDHDLDQQLASRVNALLQQEEKRLKMGSAIASLARPGAAGKIAQVLVDLAAC